MKLISLSQGKASIVDDFDFETFGHLRWRLNDSGYAVRSGQMSDGRNRIVYMHRLVALAHSGEQVHHLDGNRLNNQSYNLQRLPPGEHSRLHGISRGPSSGTYRGVTFHKPRQKWAAQIKVNGQHIHLGLFVEPEDAARAWDAAARATYGPECYQNFPDPTAAPPRRHTA